MIFLLSVLIIWLVVVLGMISLVLGVSFLSEEGDKVFPLESGFMTIGGLSFFSLQFFFLMLIFILFDLEIVFLFSGLFISVGGFFMYMFILFIVGFTLWLEWEWGKLVWTL